MKPQLPICSLDHHHVIYNALRSWVRKLCLCYFILLHTSLGAQPLDIKFDRFDQWANAPKGDIQHITQDIYGFLWLESAKGHTRFDGNEFRLFKKKPPYANDQPNISLECTDQTGNRWVGVQKEIIQKKKNGHFRKISLPAGLGACRALFEHPAVGKDSILWVLTDNSLLCLHTRKLTFTRIFKSSVYDPQSLYGVPFHCAFFSAKGILWLGGKTGFCKYDWRNQEFRQYRLKPDKWSRTGDINFLCGVEGDTSRCWATSTDKGLFQYDLYQKKTIENQMHPKIDAIKNRDVFGVIYDPLGRLWVGNANDTLLVLNLNQRKIEARIPQYKNLVHFGDFDFSRKWFWYIINRGESDMACVRIISKSIQIDTFRLPFWRKKEPNNQIVSWIPDREGTLWFLRANRFVECFNPQPYRLEQKDLQYMQGITADLSAARKLRYDVDRKTLWLCTDIALVKINWEKETAETYVNPLQPLNEQFSRMEIDDRGRVWLNCNVVNVFYVFDPYLKTFATYNWKDGLRNENTDETLPRSVYNKWLQRHPNHSFTLFTPERIEGQPVNAPLIDRFVSYGMKSIDCLIKQTKNLQLSTNAKNLQIIYTAPDFEQGHSLCFRYRLSGVDTGWVEAGLARTAVYRDLPAGQYRFQVMVANREGKWNPQAATLDFVIPVPVYREPWFPPALSLLLIGIFFAVLRRRDLLRSKRYQFRQQIADDLHEQVAQELQYIQVLVDGDFGSSSPSHQLTQRINQQATTVNQKLGDLIWLINPDNDTIAQVIDHFTEEAKARLVPYGIVPQIFIAPMNIKRKIPIEQRKKLYFNFNAALNQVSEIKPPKNVQLFFAMHHHQLWIEVRINE